MQVKVKSSSYFTKVKLQKPMFEVKVLQILQGYFLGFHLRIPVLKFPDEPV